MDLYEIEYFLAIVKTLNISRAAEQVFISQSALSQFLVKLEASLGVRLFNRVGRRLELTEAGEIYYKSALEIKECKERTLRSISKLAERDSQSLTVGITGSRSLNYVLGLIPLMKQKYPSFQINYIQNDVSQHTEDIRHRKIDCAFGAINYVNDVHIELLKDDPIGCFVSSQNRLFSETKDYELTIADLKRENFVLLSKGNALRQICDQYFKEHGISPSIYIECSQFTSLFDIVNHHDIITLHSAKYHTEMPESRFFSLPDAPKYQLGLMYDNNNIKSSCLEDFIHLAIERKQEY